MNVLVIRCFVPESDDLHIMMVATADEGFPMVSPLVRLEGAAPNASGNPYGVYGEACERFTGKNKFDLNITVAAITSGDLETYCAGQCA